jgi:hypothetical protein
MRQRAIVVVPYRPAMRSLCARISATLPYQRRAAMRRWTSGPASKNIVVTDPAAAPGRLSGRFDLSTGTYFVTIACVGYNHLMSGLPDIADPRELCPYRYVTDAAATHGGTGRCCDGNRSWTSPRLRLAQTLRPLTR